jgi:choloylglycine hydrolase
MSIRRIASLCSLIGALVASPVTASACTSILIPTSEGGYVYGRTLEFAAPLNSDIIAIPRGYELKGTGPDGTAGTGLVYKAKYATIGLNGLKLPIIVDGMNEKGLIGGALYLPRLAEYQETTPQDAKNSVASYEILAYILTNFGSVDEVKANLARIKVNRSPHPQFKGVVPLHYTLHDATGKSLVVEYIGGQLQMTDNPTHVMTNAPEIRWHLNNVSLYGGISPEPTAPLTIGGTTMMSPSTGNNTIGLPADFSAPSRFVRAMFYSQAAPQPKNGQEGVNTVFHIMNQFDIPPGAIRTSAKSESGGGVDGIEITEWTTVMDSKTGALYVRTFENSQTRKISLSSLDLNAKELRTFALNQAESEVDVVK